MPKPLLTLLLLVSSLPGRSVAFAPQDAKAIRLGVGMSESLTFARLQRAAIGDGKIARVRSPSDNSLLVTGLKPGKTLLRIWDDKDRETALRVTVVAAELDPTFHSERDREVVKVALEFLELDRAIGRDVGLHWPETLQFNAAARVTGAAATSGLNYTAGLQSAQGFLQLLVRNGWAKVLASPDLFVRLGEEATFQSGGELPVPSTSETYGRLQRHIEWKEYGLVVKVRPQSGDGLHIRSDIHLEMSEPNPAHGIDGVPALNRRNLDTKMNSDDGETVILSGLVREVSSESKEGIPILSSIPLLGGLFSHHSEKSEQTELMMAITFSLTTRARERQQLERFRETYRGAQGE